MVLWIALLTPATTPAAQDLTGRVTDSMGGPLPIATVTAHYVDADGDQTALSTGSGQPTIPHLKVENYSVTAD
jgi:hypothetical protein